MSVNINKKSVWKFFCAAVCLCLFGFNTQNANADEYSYFWVPTTGNHIAGRANYIQSTYNSDTNVFSYYVNFTPTYGRLPHTFTLALNNGPNPKGHPGELALLYFDASRYLDSPATEDIVLTAYGYNGLNALTSYRDGDGDTAGDQAPDKIASSILDGSWVLDLTARDEIDGSRTLGLRINATAINSHTPLYTHPDVTWHGIGFDDAFGQWMHPSHIRYGSGETYPGYSEGYLTSWGWYKTGWYDTTYQCTENDQSGAVCGKKQPKACETPKVIDFGGLDAGTVVTDQFASLATVSALGGSNDAMIFDTSCPGGTCSGQDQDLGTPNEVFGGPGVGSGAAAGAGNDTAQYNMLIISEDGDSSDPDDNGNGGCLRFDFDEPTEVVSVRVVDMELHTSGSLIGLDGSGATVFTQPFEGIADNSAMTVNVNYDTDPYTVEALLVCYNTSGAIDDLEICQCNPDQCGVCDGDNSTCTDCAGVPNGDHVEDDIGGCCLEEEKDDCGRCFGDNTCTDCLGVPNGDAELDVCGVCEGDGTSCLNCESIDITQTQTVLDGGAKQQEHLIKTVLKRIKRVARLKGKRIPKRFIKNMKAQAHELQIRNWILSWTMPSVMDLCDNTELCVTVDNAGILAEYRLHNEELRQLTFKATKKLRRIAKKGKRYVRRYTKKANKLAKDNSDLADTVPVTANSCDF